MRVLLAEDDETLGSGLKAGLAQHGFQVDWVRDGVAAEREMLTQVHEVVILDMGLPRQDGLVSLQKIRQKKIRIPVLILTAQDAVSYRIEGLDAGADDYLVKPVDLLELAARL
jgi:two-component system OmpR family response regulator/two-component system response regulator QseB